MPYQVVPIIVMNGYPTRSGNGAISTRPIPILKFVFMAHNFRTRASFAEIVNEKVGCGGNKIAKAASAARGDKKGKNAAQCAPMAPMWKQASRII